MPSPCKACAGITLSALRDRPGYLHSPNFNSLSSSSKSCSLCGILWDTTRRANLFKLRSASANAEDAVYLQVDEPHEEDGLLREMKIVTQHPGSADDFDWGDIDLEGYAEDLARIALYSDPGSPAAMVVTSQKAELNSDSEAAFETVHRWLWDCSMNHPKCPNLGAACLKYRPSGEDNQSIMLREKQRFGILSNDQITDDSSAEGDCENADAQSSEQEALPTLPSRVLDVGPPDGSQEPYLYICKNATSGFWIALSHCWGTVPLLRTTSKTISSYIRAIPMSTLPPSFRDAVIIIRKLGIRYLWIDSLCIIQDDLEDWRIESSKMAGIYGASFLTIIAAGASNSHGGCFVPRSIRFPPASLHPSDSPGPFWATESFMDSTTISKSTREPIDRRGWCFQEALLPKRTLSYGTKMMTWRCQTGSFPEQGGRRTEPVTLYYGLDREEYGYSRWEQIVQEYTQRSLTQEKDALIALAGIAEELSRIWNDAYFAGLWRGDLIRQLLWQVDGGKDDTTGCEAVATRPVEYRAPSWSWATVNNSVLFFAHWLKDFDELTTLIDAEVVPLGSTPFGEIKSGVLRLKGPLERATGQWKATPRHNHMWQVVDGLTQDRKTATCFLDVPEERHWPSTEIWLLRMVSKFCEPDWVGDDPDLRVLKVYALLLIPTRRVEDEYTRVGSAKLDFDAPEMSMVRTVTIV